MTQTTKTKAKKATKPAKRKMNVGGAVAVKPKKKRNYAQENARYKSRPDQIAKRTSRNKARRAAIKSGVVRKGDGKDVDHKNGNPMDNRPSNLRAIPASANRSFPRNKRAGKLGLSRGGSTVNAAGNYTKPSMRKNLFNSIKAGGKGGNPGQWSARKAQMLAKQYKAKGGGYKS